MTASLEGDEVVSPNFGICDTTLLPNKVILMYVQMYVDQDHDDDFHLLQLINLFNFK